MVIDYYFLMHEDIRLALFSVSESDTVENVKFNDSAFNMLPFGVCSTSTKSLRDWLNNRRIPATRHGIKSMIAECGVTSTFRLMIDNLGLSLTDHYWLCPLNGNYTWDSINLYTNYFDAKYSLDIKDDIGSKINFTPSSSLKGDLKKKWIIDSNGIRRLVKGNYNNSCRQSICEVFATAIHKMQNSFRYTPYSLIKISSNNKIIIGCECPNFTSINTEFISAIDVIDSAKKPNDISYYEFYCRLCEQNGLNVRQFLEYQIMIDFLISNTDRHLNNFGIIRGSKTLEWLEPAPIFDSGNSMFYNESCVPVGEALLDIDVTSFLKKEVQLLRYVTNRDLVNMDLLPSDNYLYSLLKKDTIIKDEENEKIIRAFNRKKQYLLDFKNGAKLWNYRYRN